MAFRGKKFSAIKISPILGKWHLGEIFSEEWVLAETWQAVRVAIGKFTFFDGIMMR
jgi:hypothetical protein